MFLSLATLAVVTFAIMAPAAANAQQSPYGGYISSAPTNNQPVYYQPAPTYYPPAPTPTYIYVPTPGPTKIVYRDAPAPAPTSKVSMTADISPTNTSMNKTTNNTDLAANAIFASNSFLPAGIVQWIFFAILVLLVVILVRKIYGADEAYHAVPLKHD